MCTVSVVFDYGRQMWPQPPPGVYQTIPAPPAGPTPEQWAEFLELVEKARKFDEIAGQPDCEDPAKGEWMRAIEERIASLEGRCTP